MAMADEEDNLVSDNHSDKLHFVDNMSKTLVEAKKDKISSS